MSRKLTGHLWSIRTIPVLVSGGTGRPTGDHRHTQAAFVRRTHGRNDHPQDDVPLICGFWEYHVNSRGWNAIHYNFLVYQFRRSGTIAGGIDKPVVGAEVEGYHTGTTGVAALENHVDDSETTADADPVTGGHYFAAPSKRSEPGMGSARSGSIVRDCTALTPRP
jgi:hypothetical protein